MSVRVSDIFEIMTPIEKTDTILQGIAAMLSADTSFFPVADETLNYCGVVTLKSLVRAWEEGGCDKPVAALLENTVQVMPLDGDTGDLTVLAGRTVVVDADNKVAGIITSRSLTGGLLRVVLNMDVMDRRHTGKDIAAVDFNHIKGLSLELRAIVDSLPDGIFITDGDGVVLKANEAYERISGIKADDIIGKGMLDLVKEGLYDETTLSVLKWRESVTVSQTSRNGNHLLVTGTPVLDERGEIFRVVTCLRELTETGDPAKKLSRVEEQKMRYGHELAQLRSLQLKCPDIIFCSKAMSEVVDLAANVARVNSTVLITGESGTGKELIAKLIHREGKGPEKPFVQINCGAIPESLLESELFGYEGGAFTGAKKEGKVGLFELANHGTLFLDEIAEMSPFLQVKLLHASQEKTITRVGGTAPVHVDVRIIAATHRDLAKMVEEGTFRKDLYYRLMVVPIHIPPLRERKEDIPLLALHFVDKFNKEFGFAKNISSQVIDELGEYCWPGNVRELEHIIERMMVITRGEEITPAALPATITQNPQRSLKAGTKLKEALYQAEKVLLAETFREYGSWQRVAEVLGIDRTTAFRKAMKYGLIDNRK